MRPHDYARRDATSNLRYKFGLGLARGRSQAVFGVSDEKLLRFPPGRMATNYLCARGLLLRVSDEAARYQARYRDRFYTRCEPEEMILPVSLLTPHEALSAHPRLPAPYTGLFALAIISMVIFALSTQSASHCSSITRLLFRGGEAARALAGSCRAARIW